MNEFVKQIYTSQGDVNIQGIAVPYNTTSENFPVKRLDGRYDGSTFTYAYERKDIETDGRPILL